MAKRRQEKKSRKSPSIRKKKPISNLVIVSDTHCGCQLGLCPRTGWRRDEGGHYTPSKLQKIVWSWWEEFWGEWVPHVTRGEPFAVCMNGDAIDGVHHRATHQITQNLAVQGEIAYDVLKPVFDLCEGRYYHVRGTEAHVGQSGQEEERLAERLGAIKDNDGRAARWELWIRIGRALVHLSHHIGTTGSMHYESTALMRELTEAYVEAGRWKDEPPDVVIRSHRHRNSEVRVMTAKGFATVATTAGWQLKTPFTFKVAGGRQSRPQIGGTIVRCGDEEIFTRHKVWSLERPKEEAPV